MSLGIGFSGSSNGKTAADGLARVDARRLYTLAGQKLLPGVRKAIERAGPGWQPLAKATVEERRRLGFPAGPPLKRTGGFERQFQGEVDEAGVTIVNDDWRYPILTGGKGNIPARPIVVADEDQREAFRAVHDAAVGK